MGRAAYKYMPTLHPLLSVFFIAIDGKTLRRSHDRRRGKQAIHMISAWATGAGTIF
jgi:hypothetical protein